MRWAPSVWATLLQTTVPYKDHPECPAVVILNPTATLLQHTVHQCSRTLCTAAGRARGDGGWNPGVLLPPLEQAPGQARGAPSEAQENGKDVRGENKNQSDTRRMKTS